MRALVSAVIVLAIVLALLLSVGGLWLLVYILRGLTTSEILYSVLGIAAVLALGLLIWLVARRDRDALFHFGRFFGWAFGRNNRVIWIAFILFLLSLGNLTYHVGARVVHVADHPVLQQTTQAPAHQSSFRRHLQLLRGAKNEAVVQVTSQKTAGWFIKWTIITFGLFILWVLSLIIFLRDDLGRAFHAAQERMRHHAQGGVVLAGGRQTILGQFANRLMDRQQQAAAPAAGQEAPQGAAQPVAQAPRTSWFERWGHWIPLLLLLAEEYMENRRRGRRRLEEAIDAE